MGHVIAEYSDYALAYQLVGDAFIESLGEGQRYTDDRIRLIEKIGPFTPKVLSAKFSISGAAVTQWMKPWIEKGVLDWCDENNNGFSDVAELEKAKRTGKAYIIVSERCCLPTPYQLTGDSRWDEGGELYILYDLGIEESGRVEVGAEDCPENDAEENVEENIDASDVDGGVKVLSEKTGSDHNFKNDNLDPELVPVSIDGLSDEFRDLLRMN